MCRPGLRTPQSHGCSAEHYQRARSSSTRNTQPAEHRTCAPIERTVQSTVCQPAMNAHLDASTPVSVPFLCRRNIRKLMNCIRLHESDTALATSDTATAIVTAHTYVVSSMMLTEFLCFVPTVENGENTLNAHRLLVSVNLHSLAADRDLHVRVMTIEFEHTSVVPYADFWNLNPRWTDLNSEIRNVFRVSCFSSRRVSSHRENRITLNGRLAVFAALKPFTTVSTAKTAAATAAAVAAVETMLEMRSVDDTRTASRQRWRLESRSCVSRGASTNNTNVPPPPLWSPALPPLPCSNTRLDLRAEEPSQLHLATCTAGCRHLATMAQRSVDQLMGERSAQRTRRGGWICERSRSCASYTWPPVPRGAENRGTSGTLMTSRRRQTACSSSSER